MNNSYYECPGPHDGILDIQFKQIIMPHGMQDYHIGTPSVNNPRDYKYLPLISKNLAWHGYDVIKAHNTEEGNDAVIYLGHWKEQQTTFTNQ